MHIPYLCHLQVPLTYHSIFFNLPNINNITTISWWINVDSRNWDSTLGLVELSVQGQFCALVEHYLPLFTKENNFIFIIILIMLKPLLQHTLPTCFRALSSWSAAASHTQLGFLCKYISHTILDSALIFVKFI